MFDNTKVIYNFNQIHKTHQLAVHNPTKVFMVHLIQNANEDKYHCHCDLHYTWKMIKGERNLYASYIC